jgi:alpha-pyrone synthase
MNATQIKNQEINATKAKIVLPIIEGIATGTPQHIIRQSDAARVVASLPGLDKNRSRIEKIYGNTQIETRHLAIDLLSAETIAFSQRQGNLRSRMELYQQYAVPLAERVSRKALESAAKNAQGDVSKGSAKIEDTIRLVVFVSSTGFIGTATRYGKGDSEFYGLCSSHEWATCCLRSCPCESQAQSLARLS